MSFETLRAYEQTNAVCKPFLDKPSTGFALDAHIKFLESSLKPFPAPYTVLDASKTWIIYWELVSLALLGRLTDDVKEQAVHTLATFRGPNGGFTNGLGHKEHILTTYAAVLSICLCNNSEAYDLIDKKRLLDWLMSLRNADGSFRVHDEGECDSRASYAAVCIAYLVDGVNYPHLFDGTLDWLLQCQTYEGGFAGNPGTEAHGGYTFCSLAAISVLNGSSRVRRIPLARWLTQRQDAILGGLSGRTNKLVDGCYSWWVGASVNLFALEANSDSDTRPLIKSEKLQEYIYQCCQPATGGLRDKPPKPADLYHTCYCLLGLSSIAHNYRLVDNRVHAQNSSSPRYDDYPSLQPAHPVCCVPVNDAESMITHFSSLQC
ncbi:farnesyltransferase beta subunit Cpp1 [Schizosaccharomyces japonicus yFS275]|uniref:Protein farnesyltransferase subunit beta n=1 Tax=Schizosaccharomyces japonicus (strain yFS275 / FY16936) TaxID=402676 RepID=B6K0M5_SCHJY|nr:farnesyltransferase beta subunit Cpp1 [Schizosaccharomyces japonicus yFS275]EEB07496.1 farnesyltransferase beta subunit Cpp1 [Schizosaccharomyces japonicus yFS275]